MLHRSIRRGSLALPACFVVLLLPSVAPTQSPTGKKHALRVGVRHDASARKSANQGHADARSPLAKLPKD